MTRSTKNPQSLDIQDKATKFHRLAERRVNEALKKLRLVANLSNKRNYSYTDEHAKLIVEALEAEFKHLKTKFREESCLEEIKFSLKDKRS
jgi:hypothetical protein